MGYFDKPQYNANDFVTLSGGDAFDYINFAPEERNRLKDNIISVVQNNDICSLIELDTILRTMPFERHIYNNMAVSSIVNDYIKEQAHKSEQEKLVYMQAQQIRLLEVLVDHVTSSTVIDQKTAVNKSAGIDKSVWKKFECNKKK